MPESLTSTIPATVTSKGQITIPAAIRRRLGVRQGGHVLFTVRADEVTLTSPRYPTIASLRGVAGQLSKPLSWEEMKRIAYEDRMTKTGKRKLWKLRF